MFFCHPKPSPYPATPTNKYKNPHLSIRAHRIKPAFSLVLECNGVNCMIANGWIYPVKFEHHFKSRNVSSYICILLVLYSLLLLYKDQGHIIFYYPSSMATARHCTKYFHKCQKFLGRFSDKNWI